MIVKNLLIKGNAKMGPQVYLYNLPPIITCSPTKWCLEGRNGKPACYALRNNYTLPSTKAALQARYELSKQEDFAEKIIDEIHRKKARFFRFHSSGDIYSEKYAKKIIQVAKKCLDTLFRTTTRRRDLTHVILELNSLPNFTVRESLDTERTIPKMGLPFAALSHLEIVKNSDSYMCLDDCVKCNYYCWKHECNIHFEAF